MRAKDLNAQLSRLAENPIARVVAYYILLFAATGPASSNWCPRRRR